MLATIQFVVVIWCLKRDYILQNYNFAGSSVWMWYFVSDIKGRTQTEGIRGQGAQESICTKEGWINSRFEKIV
jgi:hypothetical protein